jgi:hypothetical protein
MPISTSSPVAVANRCSVMVPHDWGSDQFAEGKLVGPGAVGAVGVAGAVAGEKDKEASSAHRCSTTIGPY